MPVKELLNNKTSILHIVQGLKIGGAETMLLQYIKALGFERYRHFVFNIWQDGTVKQSVEKMGVPVSNGPERQSAGKPIKFLIWITHLMKELSAFIKENRIDVIRSDLGLANQIAIIAGRLSSVPAFPTVHSTMAFVDRRTFKDPRRHINYIANRFLYRQATRVIAVSEEVKETIHRSLNINMSNISVVKNGIIFNNTDRNIIKQLEEENRKGHAIQCISVGNLDYEKAFDILIKAVYKLVSIKKIDNFKVFIAGEGEERTKLEGMINEYNLNNYIKLLGIRKDVMQLLSESDIFILPSRYEGLSVAMIEAMASGLPIIGSNAPGVKNYIIDGENALVFNVDDDEGLSFRMQRLIEDLELRMRLGKGAKNTFNRDFNMEKNITAMHDLFQEFTGNDK